MVGSGISGGVVSSGRRSYINLIVRAAEWEKEIEGEVEAGVPALLDLFYSTSLDLDSLLGMYMPIDTLSGRIGLERVERIAECYTDLEMYEDARSWWKLLRRIDTKEYFKQETIRGLLQCGIELSDTLLLSGVLDGSEFWSSPLKRELGTELLAALDYLYLKKTDPGWLEKRYRRLKRFLPETGSVLLEVRINGDRGRWRTAYGLCKWLVGRVHPDELDACQARRLLEWLWRTSVLSGEFADAKAIVAAIIEHGDIPLATKVRTWLPGFDFLEGRLDTALEQYLSICSQDPAQASSCFWQQYIERFKEVTANLPPGTL